MSNILPNIETFAKGAFATAAGLSTVGAGLLWYGQNYLIYPSAFPPGSRTEVATPAEFGLPYEDLVLNTSDGITLRCYLLLQSKELDHPQTANLAYGSRESEEQFRSGRPIVLMFHGNGGNHGHRIPLAKTFFLRMRCNVLMLSYRGYGKSDGEPSEKGLCLDAQTALDFVKSDPVLSKCPLVLYGQSIGGAIDALVLENTFLSLPRLIPHALPALKHAAFLCHQKWDSASKIPLIPAETPILMLSGVLDEVVPKEHMRQLWEIVTKRGEKGNTTVNLRHSKAGLERAKFVEFEDGDHNNTCVQPGYWQAIADFIGSLSYLEIPNASRRS
ncbi:hypothetical protein ONZ45_g16114 [Pleurotus djamor]|nr:hypothetical protein ONZ45_g16114 [Pleurotus djamor]